MEPFSCLVHCSCWSVQNLFYSNNPKTALTKLMFWTLALKHSKQYASLWCWRLFMGLGKGASSRVQNYLCLSYSIYLLTHLLTVTQFLTQMLGLTYSPLSYSLRVYSLVVYLLIVYSLMVYLLITSWLSYTHFLIFYIAIYLFLQLLNEEITDLVSNLFLLGSSTYIPT